MSYVIGVFSPYILYAFMKLFVMEQHMEGFPKTYFLFLLPLAMFLMTITYARDEGGIELVGIIGIALAVIPALIIHINLLREVSPDAVRADFITSWRMLALLFPAVTIGCLNNFWAKGTGFSGFMIPWARAVGFVPLLLLAWIFFSRLAIVTFVIASFVLGLVGLAAMVILRLVLGSPFY